MSSPDRPSDYEPHVGTGFHTTAGPVLELVSVLRLDRHGSPREEPFSLLFVNADDIVFSQQMLELQHAALGDVVVFVVPVGPDEHGRMQYEAVFN